jgi:hypothetical protein
MVGVHRRPAAGWPKRRGQLAIYRSASSSWTAPYHADRSSWGVSGAYLQRCRSEMVIRVIPDMPVRSPNNTVESIPNHYVRCLPSAALARPRRYHRRCSDVQAQRGTSRRASRPIAGRCRCERCLGDRGQGVFCQRSPNRSQGVGHMSWFRVASRADDRRRVQLRFAGPRRVIAIGSWCRTWWQEVPTILPESDDDLRATAICIPASPGRKATAWVGELGDHQHLSMCPPGVTL